MNKSAIFISIIIIGLILLLLLICIFGILYFYWGNSTSIKDSLSTTGSIFGAIATLGAAGVAAYLFNDWRDEKNYELENSLLTNILIDLKPIFIELHKIRSDSQNLRKIDSNLIVKTSYLERERIDMFKSIISLFPNIKIYCEIKGDKELINLYNIFDKHCFIMEDFFNELFFIRYRRYYEKVNNDNLLNNSNLSSVSSFDIFRPYSQSRKELLLIEIAEILNMFKKNSLGATIDNKVVFVSYESWLEETIKIHNQIQDYCIEHLKVSEGKTH
ncbi:hypothetical protein [Acinetobacter pittii]|uniref:DUF4760 domain-containing protein n=1 Tax=Acinetobacter pittii TaxID=48296 RepID=A0AAE9MBU5_ACIPI|nr:hypothetical protein [Acinetobacter pittii]MCU4644290.1 hypothetical protein [Acinetobacter pittii]OTT04072.1 hypothetical protein CAT55_16135 [Acinetobacter pittii]PSD77506.1 hypothetical protein C7G49_02365 [Acinetobacter pittii]USU95886.1 hypothetical protein MWH18_06405 [Acinetobacter pittii]